MAQYKIVESVVQGKRVFQIKKKIIFFWKTVSVLYKSEIEEFPIIWTDYFSSREQAEFYLNEVKSDGS